MLCMFVGGMGPANVCVSVWPAYVFFSVWTAGIDLDMLSFFCLINLL